MGSTSDALYRAFGAIQPQIVEDHSHVEWTIGMCSRLVMLAAAEAAAGSIPYVACSESD